MLYLNSLYNWHLISDGDVEGYAIVLLINILYDTVCVTVLYVLFASVLVIVVLFKFVRIEFLLFVNVPLILNVPNCDVK